MSDSGFPLPENEERRLGALLDYEIMDTLPEQVYDDFTALASQIFHCPIAMVSLLDDHRQWFKSKVGLDTSETPRSVAFCAHAILDPGEVMVVEDARLDTRFTTTPLVQSDPHVRFYAGAPLVTPDGDAVGTICVIDREPRTATPEQSEALRMLSRQIVSHLELRKSIASLERVVLEKEAHVEKLEEYQRELEQAETDLRTQAHTDALTGVGNRRALATRLEDEFTRSKRYQTECSMAMIDIDHFKQYNDEHGHLAGDEALVKVANLLRADLRAQDFLARFGGEEFVILLPNTSLSGALVMGERFRRTIQAASWGARPVTISVGIASMREGADEHDDLLAEADLALYRAKRDGRNRVSGPAADALSA